MKILFLAPRYDYGDPRRGDSFEYETFFPVLRRLADELLLFDFVTLLGELGYEQMHRRLWDTVVREEPDLLFCVLFENQLDRAVLRRIKEDTRTVSLNWFCDDDWRFESFSRHWAPAFDWVATTNDHAFERYNEMPGVRAVRTQWGVDPEVFRPVPTDEAHDVSFVGQMRPARRRHVRKLERSGLTPHVRGLGWPGGRVSQDEMVRIFAGSRITLNFSDSATAPGIRLGPRALKQLKARVFELAACGPLVVTERTPSLERYLVPGKEVVTFRGGRDLVRTVRHFLEHRDEREAIARAGYERTISEHTYIKRFEAIFQEVGLPWPDVREAAPRGSG